MQKNLLTHFKQPATHLISQPKFHASGPQVVHQSSRPWKAHTCWPIFLLTCISPFVVCLKTGFPPRVNALRWFCQCVSMLIIILPFQLPEFCWLNSTKISDTPIYSRPQKTIDKPWPSVSTASRNDVSSVRRLVRTPWPYLCWPRHWPLYLTPSREVSGWKKI